MRNLYEIDLIAIEVSIGIGRLNTPPPSRLL